MVVERGSRESVEKCRHQDTKSQRFLKVKKIQRSSSCLGDFVAELMFSTALLGQVAVADLTRREGIESGGGRSERYISMP